MRPEYAGDTTKEKDAPDQRSYFTFHLFLNFFSGASGAIAVLVGNEMIMS
jgi:hypothetical protein